MPSRRGRREQEPREAQAVEGIMPPHDMDAEAAVLSAVMVDPEAIERVLGILRPEDFYSEAHRAIFAAARALKERGQPVDVVQVGGELKREDRIRQVGGMQYLTEILNASPAVLNVEAHARTVVDKSRQRKLAAKCQRTIAQIYAGGVLAQDILDEVHAAVGELAREGVSGGPVPVKDTVRENAIRLQAAATRGERMTGRTTGFDRYDRMTAGLHDGDLTIVAGRPGMAKTALVLNIGENVASLVSVDGQPVERHGVIVFSLEMPKEQNADRLVCASGRIDLAKLRVPAMLTPKDWERYTASAKHFSGDVPIWVDDTPAISLLEIRKRVKRLQAEWDRPGQRRIGLTIIDYLQLMKGRDDAASREQEISEISRGLKGMAKELRMPVIAISQLNRSCETRSDKRPQLSDLRESGAIEQDADNIVFIYRDEYYNPETPHRNIAELIIAKQRNGPTGVVKVRFDREYTRFDNIAEGEYPDEDAA